MTRKSSNGHRVNKDGLPETLGEIHDRVELRGNAKAVGAGVLIVGGLFSVFNGVAADYPFMSEAINVLTDNLERSINLARIAQVFSGVAEVAGGIWMGVSAVKDASKRRSVEGYMNSLGRDYRPGDRKRADEAAAAGATSGATSAAQQAEYDGNEPS